MTERVVAVHHNIWPPELIRPNTRNPAGLFRYAVWYKANPRSPDYLRALLEERFPGAEWIDTADPEWMRRLAQADRVVLLYPDAIGLGFSAVERAVQANKKTWAAVTVLNGRRRAFLLNGATRRGLRLRRLLEWTMLPELVFLPVFIALTPLLWAADRVKGRT